MEAVLETMFFWRYHGHAIGYSLDNDQENQMKGRKFFCSPALEDNGTILTSLNEISEELACSFARNLSLAICLLGFLANPDTSEN